MSSVKKCLGRFIIFIGVALVLPLLCVITVQAVENASPRTSIANPGNDGVNIQGVVASVNAKLDAAKLIPPDMPFLKLSWNGRGDDTLIIFLNKSWYLTLSQNSKEDVMTIALSEVYNSNISVTNKNKIYNFISGEDSSTASLVRLLSNDVQTDYMGAYAWIRPFSGPVSTFLGVLALLVFIFMGLMVTIDCFYIGNPWVQWVLSSKSEEKPFIVSKEAFDAVKLSQEAAANNYVNPYTVYAKRKTGQIIAMCIILLYLISGRIFDLVANVMDYFNSVI